MKESARYILQILVFVALILSIGTVGYLVIEDGISVSDAFYMTVTAITPTQFHEIHELSVMGRYFTVGLVFCGFGAVVAFATQFARLVIQSELEGVGVITRKQMRRRIGRMKDHYIVCGYGKIGGAICTELKDQQLPFVVITDDEASISAIQREGFALVRGNPSADASLREAAIERAQGVIAVLTDDSNNLFISLAARELNPRIFIIARGEDSGVEDRILRAGADIVVSPMKLGGRQIAELIKQQTGTSTRVPGASEPSSVRGLRLTVYCHAGDEATTVSDVVGASNAVGAAAIERRDGRFESTPPADAVVNLNDTVVLITRISAAGDSCIKHPTGTTILIADDHRALRLLFTRKLAAAGHDVIQAESGEDALSKTRAQHPDLIVLDVNMPQQSGYDVCRTLRQSGEFAELPIILYSGDNTDEFVERGLAAGADMCVRKTSKSSELLTSIDRVLSQRRVGRRGDETKTAPNTSSSPAPPGDQPAGGHVWDADLAIENADGDRDLLNELVAVTLQETPRMMDRIDAAVSQRDYASLEGAAHSLKSSLVVLGADQAYDAAAKLELAGKLRSSEQIEGLHEALKSRIAAVTEALEHHIA